MTPSSGQMDATICGKCCKHLAFSAKYVGTHCQPARITGRNTSNTTHAVPSKRFHPCAAPSALQNKVASATPHNGRSHDSFPVPRASKLSVHGRLPFFLSSWLYLYVD